VGAELAVIVDGGGGRMVAVLLSVDVNVLPLAGGQILVVAHMAIGIELKLKERFNYFEFKNRGINIHNTLTKNKTYNAERPFTQKNFMSLKVKELKLYCVYENLYNNF